MFRDLCAKIWNAKQENVLAKGAPYIAKIFDEQSCIRSVATNPSKLAEIRKCFPDINVLKIEALQIKELKF